MQKWSEIAADYLADFEVLTDARMDFDAALKAWWAALLQQHVRPALLEEAKGKPKDWDNPSSPGVYHCYPPPDRKALFLELRDPRSSNRPFYVVSLRPATRPAAKRMQRQTAIAEQLEHFSRREDVNLGALAWDREALAQIEVTIRPHDPEGTARDVTAAVRRVYRVILEQERLSAGSHGSAPTVPGSPAGGS
jgi:hypothetical protein